MEFELLGEKIVISDGRKNYMEILTYFRNMAEQAEQDFVKEYSDKFGLVFFDSTYADRFKDTYGSDHYMDNIVRRYVSKARQYLTKYEIYNLPDAVIWEKGVLAEDRDTSRLQNAFDEFIIKCLKQDLDDDEFIARIKAKFDSNNLNVYLYNDIMSMCDFVLKYLAENKVIDIQFIYKKDASEAEALYANLKDSIVTDEEIVNVMASIPANLSQEDFAAEYQKRQKPEIAFENREKMARKLIELNPREKEYYQYIFENLPHAKYEISAIAKFLSIDLSDLINRDLNNSFDLNAIANEEDALKMKKALEESMLKYGVVRSLKQEEIDKILIDFDTKARTYESNIYETREECNQAKKDDGFLYGLHGDLKNVTKDECKKYIAKIAKTSCVKSIKEKHYNLINDKIAWIDKEALEKILCNLNEKTEAEVNFAKKEIAEYDAEEKIKEPFVAKADKRIKDIWEEEDFREFSSLYLQTRVSDSFNINNNIEYIRHNGRTETKEIFINALLKLNEEDVTSAAKYAMSKDGGFFSSIFNTGKKEVYEILTLNERVVHPAIDDAISRIRAEKEANKGKGLFGAFSKIKAEVQNVASNTQMAQSKNTTGGFKFCTECGTKIAEDAMFCSKCGAKQE